MSIRKLFFFFELALSLLSSLGLAFGKISPFEPFLLLVGLVLHAVASSMFVYKAREESFLLLCTNGAALVLAVFLEIGLWFYSGSWASISMAGVTHSLLVVIHLMGVFAPAATVWGLVIVSNTVEGLLTRAVS